MQFHRQLCFFRHWCWRYPNWTQYLRFLFCFIRFSWFDYIVFDLGVCVLFQSFLHFLLLLISIRFGKFCHTGLLVDWFVIKGFVCTKFDFWYYILFNFYINSLSFALNLCKSYDELFDFCFKFDELTADILIFALSLCWSFDFFFRSIS